MVPAFSNVFSLLSHVTIRLSKRLHAFTFLQAVADVTILTNSCWCHKSYKQLLMSQLLSYSQPNVLGLLQAYSSSHNRCYIDFLRSHWHLSIKVCLTKYNRLYNLAFFHQIFVNVHNINSVDIIAVKRNNTEISIGTSIFHV